MATYVIGDVHGCYHSLMRLLDKIGYCDNDALWFTGDLVNRGKHSRKVLEFVSTRERCVNVLGNHDLYLLAVYYGHERYRGGDTFSDVLGADNVDELMMWLSCCNFIHTDEYHQAIMVHAGLPNWPLETILQRHEWLRKEMDDPVWRRDFLSTQLMGNKPKEWEEGEDSIQKARLLINFFTRMRYCSPKGCIRFGFKGLPADAPKKTLPWYEFWQQRSEKMILFGHWSALADIRPYNHIINLDTGCAWNGMLTAYCLKSNHEGISTGALTQIKCRTEDRM